MKIRCARCSIEEDITVILEGSNEGKMYKMSIRR